MTAKVLRREVASRGQSFHLGPGPLSRLNCYDRKVNLRGANPWARAGFGPSSASEWDLLCKTEKEAQEGRRRTKERVKIV